MPGSIRTVFHITANRIAADTKDNMIDTLVARVKGFLFNPVETFQQSKTDKPVTVFACFGILLLFNAILSALVALIGISIMPVREGMSYGMPVPVAVFLVMLIGGLTGTLILSVWLHLWVYLLGGRKGIMQTTYAVIYGSTPRLLLGWVPVIGLFFAIWSLALGIIGIRELQDLSTTKAILAVAIAIFIPLILLILLAAWVYTAVATVTAV